MYVDIKINKKKNYIFFKQQFLKLVVFFLCIFFVFFFKFFFENKTKIMAVKNR